MKLAADLFSKSDSKGNSLYGDQDGWVNTEISSVAARPPQDYFVEHPVLLYAPGLVIVITVLSLNLMGDGLRDALDPYMTER